MTIDEAIREIATGGEFDEFSYVFDDWWDADQSISRAKLPAIVHVLPIGGVMSIRNGRVYDREQVAIAFFDRVVRDASGEDQRAVFERMKDAAIRFVRLANASGYFGAITAWNYSVLYNQLASIVTGVMLTLEIEGDGVC